VAILKRITDLDPASQPLVGTELVELSQGSVSKKVSLTNIFGANWWAPLRAAFSSFVAPEATHAVSASTADNAIELANTEPGAGGLSLLNLAVLGDGWLDALSIVMPTIKPEWIRAGLVGFELTISGVGFPALAALNGTDVAFVNGTHDSLRTYRFDGSNWSQVGNGLTISGVGTPALAALNGTDVAFIDETQDSLRTYRFAFSIGKPHFFD